MVVHFVKQKHTGALCTFLFIPYDTDFPIFSYKNDDRFIGAFSIQAMVDSTTATPGMSYPRLKLQALTP